MFDVRKLLVKRVAHYSFLQEHAWLIKTLLHNEEVADVSWKKQINESIIIEY